MSFGNVSFRLTTRSSVKRSKNLHGFVVTRLGFQHTLETLRCIFRVSTIYVHLAQSKMWQDEISRRELCSLTSNSKFIDQTVKSLREEMKFQPGNSIEKLDRNRLGHGKLVPIGNTILLA